MNTSAARLVPIERARLASFGAVDPAPNSLESVADPEAVELSNASIVAAALGLGIYIDTLA